MGVYEQYTGLLEWWNDELDCLYVATLQCLYFSLFMQ